MKKFSRLLLVVAVLVSLVGVQLSGTQYANAQTASGAGNGLKVSPVRTDLTVNPGTSQTITVNIENVTSTTTTFQALVNDFVANPNESGQPNLILDPTKFAPAHSLKRYISAIPDVTVEPKQSKSVKVVITVPKDAAGGGYFGAVRFAPAVEGSRDKNVTLSASVGSIILVRVPGDIKDDLQIASFDVRHANNPTGSSFFTSDKDLKAVVRFQNKGNVQEQPFGKILLKKGGKTVQTVEVNNTEPRGNVLPDSVRRFTVPLKVDGYGKYTVEGNFGYLDNGQLLSASTTFYVLPVGLIVVGIILVVLIVLAIIFLPRAVKRYNQRIIRRANRRR